MQGKVSLDMKVQGSEGERKEVKERGGKVMKEEESGGSGCER